MRNLLTVVCVLFLAGSASADVNWVWYDGSPIDLEYTSGSGDSASLLIVDFQNGSYYAFDYKWDSSAAQTGWDMIQAVGVETGQSNPDSKLEYTYTDWGWGITIDSFSYDGNSETNGADAPWPSWVYYLSDNETNYFSETSMVGCDGRDIADASWDGWSWHADGWGTGNPPVPEPATMALLAIGGLAFLRKGRKEAQVK